MDNWYIEEMKRNKKNNDYERMYNALKLSIREDISFCAYENKQKMIVDYFEKLTQFDLFNDLRKMYLKEHNKCVYYRHNGICYGQKNAPKTNCKGDRRKCEQ